MSSKFATKNLEIRIHLQQKVFRISSPPNYENVFELENEDNIDLGIGYVFAMDVWDPTNYIIIENVSEVKEFDSKM